MKYTAINIGPISAAFSMARKPREFWLASYLFSYLMKCIIEEISPKAKLISPAIPPADDNSGVGLYPDRVFFKHESILNISNLLESALTRFATDIELDMPVVKDFFNVMSVTLDAKDHTEIIKVLNRQLDYLELHNLPRMASTENALMKFLKTKYNSPLFLKAFGKKTFKIDTLEDIAAYQLADTYIKKKSFHKYICIVQADGDNMGKVISKLSDEQITSLSGTLMEFGSGACHLVSHYGGLPIYAGGDDLLFIAPVGGSGQAHIFSLLASINEKYEAVQKQVEAYALNDNGEQLRTSMSYGVSITYCKFPLYESQEIARKQLSEKAKHIGNKNAIAWKLQKHSGSSFEGVLSKNDKTLFDAFNNIITTVADENLVSAVAHKLRANEALLGLWKDTSNHDVIEKRIKAFFDKIIDVEGKNQQACRYLDKARELLTQLYILMPLEPQPDCNGNDTRITTLASTIYAMLRTAKFINGEEDKNE